MLLWFKVGLLLLWCMLGVVYSGTERCREMDTRTRCSKIRRCRRVLPNLERKCTRLYGAKYTQARLKPKPLSASVNKVDLQDTPLQQAAFKDTNDMFDANIKPKDSASKADRYSYVQDTPLPEQTAENNGVIFGAKIHAGLVNVTAPPGGRAMFTCVTSGAPAPQTTVTRLGSDNDKNNSVKSRIVYNLSQIEVINIIEPVTEADEGWYRCSTQNAYGGAAADAYLTVKDICAGVRCGLQKECVANYTTLTTVCSCRDYCIGVDSMTYRPVCGTDCKDYFSSCQLKQESCKQNRGYQIEVLFQNRCPAFESLIAEIPGIPGTRYYYTNEQVELECLVGGTPHPHVLWYKAYPADKSRDTGDKSRDVTSQDTLLYVGSGPKLVFNRALLDDTAHYVCIAQNCINNRVRSAPVQVKVIQQFQTLRDQFDGRVCQVFGGAHVSTFDGYGYDFSGSCDYVLALDCLRGSWLIYGKIVACGGGHCLESVSIYYGRDIIIMARGWVVSHRGAKIKLSQDTNIQAGALSLYFDGLYVTATLATDTGVVKLIWDGISTAVIQISKEYSRYTCGLCGNYDNDPNNVVDSGIPHWLTGVSSVSDFVRSWRVDRLGRCVDDTATTSRCTKEALETSRVTCQKIFDYTEFRQCAKSTNSADYLRACVQDTCRGSFIEEEFSVPCRVGTAFLKRCRLEGYEVPDTLYQLGCPSTRLIQPAALSIGCPQQTEPFYN